MSSPAALRRIPKHVRQLPLGERIIWARKQTKLSHDQIVARMGRSNRSHLIKIEKGTHNPGNDLRDALADALGVPRDLFAEADDAEARSVAPLSPDEYAMLGALMSRLGTSLVRERVSA